MLNQWTSPVRTFGAAAGRLWDAYWDWQFRRLTRATLAALDRHTLARIGLDPREIDRFLRGTAAWHRDQPQWRGR